MSIKNALSRSVISTSSIPQVLTGNRNAAVREDNVRLLHVDAFGKATSAQVRARAMEAALQIRTMVNEFKWVCEMKSS